MNPRAGLLACAIAAGCFNPTGGTDTSNPTTSTGSSSTDDAGTNVATSDTGSGSGSTAITVSTSSSTTGDPSATTSGGVCGDGVLDLQSEECDDGNEAPDDGCSESCTKEFRRVFVTSQVWSGDLGGLEGADQKCQDAADAAGLPGVYKAWLSTTNVSPKETFVQSLVPYRQINGVEIATNWSDLLSGTLNNGIVVSELGGPPGAGVHNCVPDAARPVWTNTNNNGKSYDKDCGGWTGIGTAYAGQAGAIASDWATFCEIDCVLNTAVLYCFEQ